jgi:thioredoxin 1
MPITTVIHTNTHSIDRVLGANAPALLVFWRPGTPLPPAVDQRLDQLAQQYAGKALLAKIDADAERDLVTRFHVTATPAMLLVRNRQVEAALTGSALSQAGDWLAYAVDGRARPAAPAASPPAQPLILTDATFQKVVADSRPVLVDFWAAWCGPCRMVAPHVEKLAQEFAGRAVVAKLNVDENPVTAQRFNVMSIPTLLIFKNGNVVDTIVGAQPLPVLQQRFSRWV